MASKRAKRGKDRPPPPTKGRRLALVICNGKYQERNLSSLGGVAQDFANIQAALTSVESDFEVTALLDEGLRAVRRAISRACREAGENDTLLLYYSGMSFRGADGSLFMPVYDTELEYPEATALDTDFVLTQLRNGVCRRIVLLIDGCHAGAFFANNRGIPDGLFAITACGADEMTNDTPEGGRFTCTLLEGMRRPETDQDGDGRISIDELHEYVKAAFEKSAETAVPQKWVWNVREPIYLASTPTRVFLSYCREDEQAAHRTKADLEAAGFAVWLDLEGIRSGDWRARVTDGLNRSRAVVFLMSKASLHSDSVRKELAFAAGKSVPIIPLVLGKVADGDLSDWFRFEYAALHRYELVDGDRARVMADLGVAIRAARPGSRLPR